MISSAIDVRTSDMEVRVAQGDTIEYPVIGVKKPANTRQAWIFSDGDVVTINGLN